MLRWEAGVDEHGEPSSTAMNEDETPLEDEALERSTEAANVSPAFRGIDFGGVLAGGVGGLGIGVVIIVIQLICSSAVAMPFPRSPSVEFGSPIDRAGSLVYLAVQLAFLGTAVGMMIVGLRLAGRGPTIAAMLIVAALTLALPTTACTYSAWTSAGAAFSP
jgi:hypothetical protein